MNLTELTATNCGPSCRIRLEGSTALFYCMPPGTAEDDRVPPYDEKSVFSRKLFHHFSQPPYSECVKINEISKILHKFRNIIEIPINFHQNHFEKRRI